MNPIDPFYHPPTIAIPTQQDQQLYAGNNLGDVATLNVGAGNNAMYVDRDGLRMGSPKMTDAPFSVDMFGNVVANSIKLSSQFVQESSAGLNQLFTVNGVPGLITGSTLSFTLLRPTIIAIFVDIQGWVNVTVGGGEVGGTGRVSLLTTASGGPGIVRNYALISATAIGGTDRVGNINLAQANMHHMGTFSAGAKTIYLNGEIDTSNGATFNLFRYKMSVISLGNG